MTRHCHQCGWVYPLTGVPGRGESCHQCGSDLKVCLNCASFDARAAQQCRARRAEPVAEKHMANVGEWFDFRRGEWKGAAQGNPREDAARNQLKKLLGD